MKKMIVVGALMAGAIVYAAATVKQGGIKMGVVNQLDCGAGISCSVSSGTLHLSTSPTDGGTPITPPDQRGTYTFDAFSPAGFPYATAFAETFSVHGGEAHTMTFTITEPGIGTKKATVALYNVGDPYPICTVDVACSGSQGDASDNGCKGEIKAMSQIRLVWDGEGTCSKNPGGNVSVVVAERDA